MTTTENFLRQVNQINSQYKSEKKNVHITYYVYVYVDCVQRKSENFQYLSIQSARATAVKPFSFRTQNAHPSI